MHNSLQRHPAVWRSKVANEPFAIIKDAGPAPARKGGGVSIYPFAQMEVGDAFDAPRDIGRQKSGNDRRQGIVSACARGYAKKHNPTAKFVTRLIDENTVRCWRVA
jgi:hypothetical protein